ncbi:glycosyltransferase family 4 protein [Micromonospora sp. NPDC047740]|uniref:glycosyltransferase family 4 protein n=1 Tax=Micromonospora sp. NPDC047740 TaxID=3364254 RepID=UPI00370FFD66
MDLQIVDIAQRRRAFHDDSLRSRIVAGGWQLATSACRVAALALTHRVDVVHLNSSGGLGSVRDVVLAGIARLGRRPFVYHLRFGRVPDIARRNTVEWRLMAWVMRRSDAVIPIDPTTADAIRSRLADVRIVRIPNGAELDDIPQRAPTHAGQPGTVLFVAWVLPSKGVEDLLTAWQERDRPGWRLLIAGPADQEYVESLQQTFAPLPNVAFVGELPHREALRAMAAADLFVLPSHTEGFPNVIVEAMAVGCAIVATEVGAVSEMLEGGCGMVVPPRSPARLAAALDELTADPERRRQMGTLGRQKAHREYGMASVFDRYVQLWRSVTRPAIGESADAVASDGRERAGSH